MPKIAELTIEITNNANKARISLDKLTGSLQKVQEAKNSLDFSNIQTGGLQSLYKYVSGLTRLLDPLAQRCNSITQAFNVMGAKSATSLVKANAKVKELETKLASVENATTQVSEGLEGTADALHDVSENAKDVSKANEWVSDAFKRMTTSSKGASVGVMGLIKQFGRLMKLKIMRQIVRNIMEGFSEGIKNLYEYSRALNSVDSTNFKNTMDGYASSFYRLKNSVAAAVAPLIQAFLPVIQQVVAWVIKALEVVNQFISALQGKTTFTRATDQTVEWGDAIKDTTGKAKELERTLLGFDEINKLNDNNSGSGGVGGSSTPDYANAFEEADIDSNIKAIADKIKPLIEWIKENFDSILAVVGAIGTALLLWKIAKGVSDFFSSLFSHMGLNGAKAGQIAFGLTLSIAGFSIEALSAFDIGYSGANLKNVILTAVGGLLGIAGGLIAFGTSSLIVTIPLSLMIAEIGIAVGKGVKSAEEDDILQQNLEDIRQLHEKIKAADELLEKIKSTTVLDDLADKITSAKQYADAIFEIADKSDKSSRDVANLTTLIDEFNKLGLGDIQLEYDILADKINYSKEEVYDLIEAFKKQAEAEAYLELYKENFKFTIEAQINLDDAEKQLDDYSLELEEWIKDNWDQYQKDAAYVLEHGVAAIPTSTYQSYVKLKNQYDTLIEKQKLAGDTVKEYQDAVKLATENSEKYWKAYEDSVDETVTNINSSEIHIDVNSTEGMATLKALASYYHFDVDEAISNDSVTISADGQSMTMTIDELVAYYIDHRQAIENDVADINADNTNATNSINEITEKMNAYRLENYTAQASLDTTSANTSASELVNLYAGKVIHFDSSASTQGASNSLWALYNGWNNSVIHMSARVDQGITLPSRTGRYYISEYASGGFPDYGSLFVAGENGAGAEMVGNINGRTGVVSQGEISGIRASVEASGQREAELLAEQNALLREMLAKPNVADVNVSSILNGANRVNRRAGKTVISVG